MAHYFVDEFGPFSFPMLWQPGYETWDALAVVTQPAAMLFAADGSFIKRWYGAIPEDEVLARIAG